MVMLRKRQAKIKKCRPQDKKGGRKFPVEEQDWCLWSKKDPTDLLMSGPKKEVEKHEKDVQYFKSVSFVVKGQVFRRAALQIFIPPSQPRVFNVRTAATKQQVEKWASQVYKYMHQLEDETEQALKGVQSRGKVLGQLSGFFDQSLESEFPTAEEIMDKVTDLADQYGSEGTRLVEYSNVLVEVVRERIKWAGIVGDFLDKSLSAGLTEEDPIVTYLTEAAASLDIPGVGAEVQA